MKHDSPTSTFLTLRLHLHSVASAILHSDDEAEDALQELFVRTWQRPADKPGYYFNALRNICIDALRRRHASVEFDSVQIAQSEDSVERRDTIEHVRRIVESNLNGTVRKVFEMYVYDELDYDEISDRLGISVEAARTALSRARKTIRNKCEL